MTGTTRGDLLLPPGLMVIGATSMYLGAAVAVGLFDDLAPAAVAWLRIAGAAGDAEVRFSEFQTSEARRS